MAQLSKRHHFAWQQQSVNWTGKLYQFYEARWWNAFFASTLFFEIKALRLRHALDIGQRAIITNWYQEVEALRLDFDTVNHWWEYQQTVCDDIGDYLFIGRCPPRERSVFRGSGGMGLREYAEKFPGYRKITR